MGTVEGSMGREAKVFTKVPYRSNGRYKAYSNKPESWDTFDNIYEAYENGIEKV